MSRLYTLNARREKALKAISNALRGKSEYHELPHEKGDNSEYVTAWRTNIEAGGRKWEIHIHLTKNFPDDPPQVRAPEAGKLLLTNPHVFENGSLCVIPDSASINSDDAVGLFFHVVDSAKHILEGTEDADFQDEFSAYWNRSLGNKYTECLVIDSPETLPALFDVVFTEKYILISASSENLNQWCLNFFGKNNSFKAVKTGITANLDAPLLPEEYPNSLYDLLSLLSSKGADEAHKLLTEQIVSSFENGLVLLLQKTDNGYAMGGISYGWMALKHKKSRKGKPSHSQIINEYTPLLKNEPVTRCPVNRVDHAWIHARGGDGDDYQRRSVLIIGCGSLGGYVAHFLSRAGVTNLTLLDNDRLELANLGRHILGVESVSRWKAEALSKSLRKQMPHLRIKGIPKDWRDALRDNNDLFNDHDLVVITVADWRCEGPLNYLSRKDSLPTILFGWLEPYAVAGHCLVSVKGSGCLACRMNKYGQFGYRVAQFPGKTLKREPGGCTHYQQYGPAALLPAASLISNSALHCLSDLPKRSKLKTWVSNQEHFTRSGAEITEIWKKRINSKGYSRIYSTKWDSMKDCQVCT